MSAIELVGGTVDHTYNLYWSNSPNYEGTSAGTGEITTAPPLFVGGSDYHLQSASLAIDNGTDGSSVTTSDRDGGARPVGAGWDMGCYEYGSGGPVKPKIVRWREIQPE